MYHSVIFTTIVYFSAATLLIGSATAQTQITAPLPNLPDFDLVIENGRVLDPATGRDEILNIGISDGEIVSLTTDTKVELFFIMFYCHKFSKKLTVPKIRCQTH